VPYGEADCPYPLKYNYDTQDSFEASGYDPKQMCVLPCPNPMWSDAEWTAGVTLTLVGNGISGILSLFTVRTRSLRTLPPHMIDRCAGHCPGGQHVSDARQAAVPRHSVHLHRA
jgi:hypothetical protein